MSKEYTVEEVIKSFSDISKLIENLKGIDINKRISIIHHDLRHCNSVCCTFLEYAIRSNDYIVAKILLISGSNPNVTHKFSDGHPYLMEMACQEKNILMITLLLEYGFDIRCENKRMYTCIHICFTKKNYEILDIFSRYGVDVEKEVYGLLFVQWGKEKFIEDFHLYRSLCSKIKSSIKRG